MGDSIKAGWQRNAKAARRLAVSVETGHPLQAIAVEGTFAGRHLFPLPDGYQIGDAVMVMSFRSGKFDRPATVIGSSRLSHCLAIRVNGRRTRLTYSTQYIRPAPDGTSAA